MLLIISLSARILMVKSEWLQLPG